MRNVLVPAALAATLVPWLVCNLVGCGDTILATSCPPPDGGPPVDARPPVDGTVADGQPPLTDAQPPPGDAQPPPPTDATPDAPPGTCEAGLAACAGACVDLRTDPAHCGACGNACATLCAGATCVAVEAVSAGAEHMCARLGDRSAWCWGRNEFGQVGDGTKLPQYAPVRVEALAGVRQIATGGQHTCAVLPLGSLACWGRNTYGEVGDGTQIDRGAPTTVNLLGPGEYVAAGEVHTCARRADGSIACWGDNSLKQLGPTVAPESCAGSPCSTTPLTVAIAGAGADAGTPRVPSSGSDALRTCTLLDGVVHCWGLRDGTPTTPAGLPTDVVQLAVNAAYVCARTATGQVWCWGSNIFGVLGDGTTTDRATPARVAALSDIVEIAAGSSHVCARTSTGTVFCWGANSFGQQGDPSTTTTDTCIANGVSFACRKTPAAVPALAGLGIRQLALGDKSTCAAVANGGIRCWGKNDFGQLGNGTADSLPHAAPQPLKWPSR